MAITQALCTSFKTELLTATHNFATNGNAFKLALYAEGGGGKSSTTATKHQHLEHLQFNFQLLMQVMLL
jgi:hypothetical protein